MTEEPTFTLRAGEPGAAKALRTMAAAVRVTDPARASIIDQAAAAFEQFASRGRAGAGGFIPKR